MNNGIIRSALTDVSREIGTRFDPPTERQPSKPLFEDELAYLFSVI